MRNLFEKDRRSNSGGSKLDIIEIVCFMGFELLS
jgi:hypothetical protein